MRTLLSIAACLWLVAVASIPGESRAVRDHDVWSAPAAARAKTNPLANNPDIAAGGRKLFHQRCSVCHGEDAQGTTRAPDLTAATVQRQTDGELFWKVSSGNTRTGMPTFSFLPVQQRWQLVMHVRAHRP
jgi:mono/diheme cytochrome c family protein